MCVTNDLVSGIFLRYFLEAYLWLPGLPRPEEDETNEENRENFRNGYLEFPILRFAASYF